MEILILALYLGIIIAVTVYATKKTNKNKNAESYLVAGKALPWWIVAFTVFGSAIGGTATVGLAGNVYQFGMVAVLYSIFRGLNYVVNGIFVAPKVRTFKMINCNEYFEVVFKKRDGLLYGIIQALVLIGLTGAQVMASAVLLPSLIPGLSYHLAIIISVAFFGIMAFAGGFLAVSTTNVINALAIIIGIALCAIMGVYQTGGLGGVAASLPVTHNYMSLVEGMSPVIIVAWLLSMIVQGCAGQTEWTTAASAKSAKHARRGFIWGGVAQLPLGLLVGLIGLVAIIRFPGLETSDSALTTVASSINPIIGILALAAIWAANASSAQAFIIAAASVLTGGVRRYSKKKLTDKQEFTLSKVLVLVTTLLAYLISMLAQDIISWSINLSAIMTPFSILLICTIYAPKVLRKNTFLLLFVFCIASILLFVLIPAFAATFQHIVYPLLISTGLAFVLGLIFDRRHSITPENALAASK